METFFKVLVEQFSSIVKIMAVLFLFVLCYFIVPDSIQLALDAKQVPIFPNGSLKGIAFLTTSYFLVVIFSWIWGKALQEPTEEELNRKKFHKLNDDEKSLLISLALKNFPIAEFESDNLLIISLLEKGILYDMGYPKSSDNQIFCRVEYPYQQIIRSHILKTNMQLSS